tara:strand:+ start:643 stop:849 length:207 start_codon:yes stop_codon:yes gene_type:complete
MQFKQALDISLEIGLSTVNEAIDFIEIHAGNFFVYEEVEDELQELYETFEKVGCSFEDTIEAALRLCK